MSRDVGLRKVSTTRGKKPQKQIHQISHAARSRQIAADKVATKELYDTPDTTALFLLETAPGEVVPPRGFDPLGVPVPLGVFDPPGEPEPEPLPLPLPPESCELKQLRWSFSKAGARIDVDVQ